MFDFLKEKMKSYNWKEVYDEHYGLHKEPKVEKRDKKPCGKSIYYKGKQYNSIKEAAKDNRENYSTFWSRLKRKNRI